MQAPKRLSYQSALFWQPPELLSYTVGKDFLPELDEGSIWLQVQLPPGISLAKAKEMSDTLRARTLKHSEITYMMVQAGRNDDGTDPWTASHFEVSVGIKPYKKNGLREKLKLILFRSWQKIIKICQALPLVSLSR